AGWEPERTAPPASPQKPSTSHTTLAMNCRRWDGDRLMLNNPSATKSSAVVSNVTSNMGGLRRVAGGYTNRPMQRNRWPDRWSLSVPWIHAGIHTGWIRRGTRWDSLGFRTVGNSVLETVRDYVGQAGTWPVAFPKPRVRGSNPLRGSHLRRCGVRG